MPQPRVVELAAEDVAQAQAEAEGVVEVVMLQQPALVEAEDEPQAEAEDVGVVMLQQPAAVEAEDEPHAEAEDVGAAAVETVEGTRDPWPVDMPEPTFVTLINSP